MKKRINERQLNRIIKESVKKILKEGIVEKDNEIWYDLGTITSSSYHSDDERMGYVADTMQINTKGQTRISRICNAHFGYITKDCKEHEEEVKKCIYESLMNDYCNKQVEVLPDDINFISKPKPCIVGHSKFAKGECVIMDIVTRPTYNYRSYMRRYGQDGNDYYFKLYNPDKNILFLSKSMVKITITEEVILKVINSMKFYNLVDDFKEGKMIYRLIGNTSIDFTLPPNVSYPQQEKEHEKDDLKKQEVMPQLIQWAKSKLGNNASEEEINKLAERVFIKRYANNKKWE